MSLLVQIGLNAQWEKCTLLHMSHGHNAYIRIATEDDYITLYGVREALVEKLRSLLALIEGSEAITPPAISRHEVTPLQTIQYFQASPELQALAGEVEATLSGLIDDADRVRQMIDPADLFDETGQPVRGAQARIAEILNVPNAGAYRGRVLDVLRRLQESTTIHKSRSAGRKTA